MKSNLTNPEVPCAIMHSVCRMKKTIDKFSSLECQIAFQNWVAYIRPNLLEISAEERLICPLLACNKFHPDLKSLLNHVAGCPRLDAGDYWCPGCNQAEHFPKYDAQELTRQPNTLQRTGSRLKRAVVFFRHLSIRGCTRHCKHRSSSSTADCSERNYGDTLGECRSYLTHLNDVDKSQRIELDSRPHKGLAFDKPELAATATTTSHQSQYTSIVAQEVAGSSMLCQELDAIQTPQELPAEPFSRGSDTEYLSESKARHKSRDCISSPDEKVDLNVSQDFDNQSTVERPVSRNEPRSWSVTVAGPDFTKLVDEKGPRLNDQTIDCANPALSPDTSCQWPGLQDDAGIIDTVPTRDLVEDLRHVFMLIHIEWIFKLLSSPELYVSCPSMSSETAFDLGLRTLLQFIQGELPRTLQSTFTLMEITIACAYTLYEDRDMSLWEDLFESVLGWQYAISDTIERAIFVRSMKYLMGHQHYKGVMSYPSKDIIPSQRLPAADRSQYEREVLHIMTPAVHNPTAAELSQEPQMYIEDSLLWSQLGKGRAMNLCWEFLEDIAYAELLLRSVSPLQATTLYSPRHMDIIVDLETFIIAQLRSYREMIVLEDVIDSTELQIYNGLLRDPREVEVALLYYCKQHMPRWSSMKTQPGQPNNSSQAREACRQIISHVCNQRMTAAGWRNRHRANDMRVVLAIAREQERDQCPVSLPTYEDAVKDQFNSATASSPLSEVQLDPDLYDPTPESSKGKARGSYTLIQPNDPMPPTSVSQVQDFASLHEADGPTPSTSFSQAPYYATLNQAEGSTPPTFVGQAQVSPTVTEPDHTPPPTFDGTFLPTPPSSQGSPRSATQMIRCRYCHRMHTKGNLSRHIKRIHEDPKTWSCHVSTCTSTFTRKDAVNKHIGKVHGGVSLQRQGAKRLKK